MISLLKKKNKPSTEPAKTEKPANTWGRWLRRMFFYFNLFTLIPTGLVILAPYLPPSFNWFPTLLTLSVHWFCLIPLLWMLGWVMIRWKMAVINALILICLYPQIRHFYKRGSTLRKQVNDFTVMSYNVDAFEYKYDKAKILADSLKSIHPDILCLQEFHPVRTYQPDDPNENIIDYFKNIVGYKFHAHIELMPKRGFGMIVFSNFPVESSGRLTDEGKDAKNGISFVDVKAFGEIIRVYNVHLESYNFPMEVRRSAAENGISFRLGWELTKTLAETWRKQEQQMEIFREHLNITHPKNVIVCGDFNNPPYNYIYYHMKGDLQDGFLERGSGQGITQRSGFGNYRIDYVLASANFTFADYKVVELNTSDHFPVLARIRFKFH